MDDDVETLLWQEGSTALLALTSAAVLLVVVTLALRRVWLALGVFVGWALGVAYLAWRYRAPEAVPLHGDDRRLMAPADGVVAAVTYDAASHMFKVEVQPEWTDHRQVYWPTAGKVMEHRGAVGTDAHAVTLRTASGTEVLLVLGGPGFVSNNAVVGGTVHGGGRVGMIHPALGGPRAHADVLFRASQYAPAVSVGDRVRAGHTVLATALA